VLDACADAHNAIVPQFITRTQDARRIAWGLRQGEWAWMNPPYLRAETAKFCEAAQRNAVSNQAHVAVLVEARTDADWFYRSIQNCSHVFLLQGRIRFDPPPGINASGPRNPSALLIYSGLPEALQFPNFEASQKVRFWKWR
jgi:phage N-6-adenine-methyltransferase